MEFSSPEAMVLARVGGRQFALPAEEVREIHPVAEPAPVPDWPEHALGLLDLHGELIPLIDPAPALGGDPTPIAPAQLMLVLEGGGRPWAILVDEVVGVRDVPVQRASTLGREPLVPAPSLAHGAGSVDDATLVVLDSVRLAARLSPAHAVEGSDG